MTPRMAENKRGFLFKFETLFLYRSYHCFYIFLKNIHGLVGLIYAFILVIYKYL